MTSHFWPFAKTRRYIHGLNLDSVDQFDQYLAHRRAGHPLLPPQIPDKPNDVYGDQFLGWIDFLGLNLRPILPYEDAMMLVARMGFTTLSQWKLYFTGQLPDAMPFPTGLTAYPEQDYPSKFTGYNDWFRRFRTPFRGFRDAKEFVQALPISTPEQWWSYVSGRLGHLPTLPEDIPIMPSLVYARYWQGFDSFLVPKVDYWPYDRAREFVRSLKLRGVGEWRDYVQGEFEHLPQKPPQIPDYPENIYSEFYSYLDWLHEDGQKWRPYELASYYVSQFNFENIDEFKAWRRGDRPDLPVPPEDIPKSPWNVYDQYQSQHQFLNDGKPRFRSFLEAKKFIRPLGLKTTKDWNDYCQGKFTDLPPKPRDIPSNPFEEYFDEYEGIHDFLGVFSC